MFSYHGNSCESVHSGTLNIASLPKEVREYMSAFDFDGNGTVTTEEVMTAAHQFDASKKTNKRLVKTVWLMVGRCRLNRVETSVERAWFQRLNL